jgi:hypothetical protein
MIGTNARRLVPASTLAALMLMAAPAFADLIILDAGLACPDFNLGIEATGGNLHTKDFVDKNGNLVKSITAGKGVVLTYTNFGPDPDDPMEGQSISIDTSGSVSQTTVNPDGTLTVTATGHNGLVMFPSDVPAGPTTTHYTGKIVFHIDPVTGVFTLLSTNGPSRDVSAELAD